MLTKDQLIAQIKTIIPLNSTHTDLIEAAFEEKTLKPREYLLEAGNYCAFEGIIRQGIVRNYYKQDAKERITHFSKEGDWLSDYNSFLSKTPARLNIQALEETKLFMITRASLEVLDHNIPHWDKLGRVFFEQQFQKKERQMHVRIASTPEERYKWLLSHQADLLNRVSLNMIAQYIGIQAESLSRMRQRLASKDSF